MSDTLRTRTIRLASTFPQGSRERRALLDVLADASAKDKLTAYATRMFPQAADMAEDDRDRAMILAHTVGKQAKRLGLTPDEVSEWLQGAYGRIWVRLGNLNPGAGLKEIRTWLLKALTA